MSNTFKLCPTLLNYVQKNCPVGRKFFRRRESPPGHGPASRCVAHCMHTRHYRTMPVLHFYHSQGCSMNFPCCYLQAGFKTLSTRVNDFLGYISTRAIFVMTIRDTDQRVTLSVAGIVPAVQQIVVFVV